MFEKFSLTLQLLLLHDQKPSHIPRFQGKLSDKGKGVIRSKKSNKKKPFILHFSHYNIDTVQWCIHQATLSANFPVGNVLHFTLCVWL